MMGERDSGTRMAVSTIAIRQIGRLIQNTARHPMVSMSTPPTIGPAAIEIPTTDPHTPIARARSRGSTKICVMIDIATGLSIDPPTACRARAAIRTPTLGARLHASDPTANVTRPIWNNRFRPYRSAVAPDTINRLASTSV
ncbi:Uncharacterised protein [Mycobacteroides abscessus subsp. abscessus]|nr:Uncharacterised protein [Mycobacteroides abscessus subsp. abscessus]